jgi:uncharacterized damage-inducible protein DinB
MKKSVELANRLREVMLNGQWIANTNLKEQLFNVDWKQATQKTGNLNTIAALTFHLNYYLEGLLQVFNGGGLEISDKYSFDLPPVQSEADWNKLVNRYLENAEKFADQVEKFSDSMLDAPFAEEKYGTYLRNIEAVIEHSYYHLGQISLIRKIITQP